MISGVKIVENAIEKIPFNQLIVASELYRALPSELSIQTFFKILERLSKSDKLVHLSKGVYYRPKNTRLGRIPISEEEIADFYIKNQQGILVGYRMYNQKGITTQIGKKVEILSTVLPEEKKHICNVYIQKITVPVTEETIPVIETMEILQAYQEIEDINKKVLLKYMTGFAKIYSDTAVQTVLENRKYKKSTIAFLASFLNYHGVEHTLNRYLSSMSEYKIPDVEELYEFA